MSHIIPALLTDDINELQDKLNQLADLAEWAQIDLMDGQFVNNKSVAPEELAQLQTDLNLEAHLMANDPAAWLPHLNSEMFRRVYFHIEAVPEPDELLTQIKQIGLETGLAMNPDTPLESISGYADYIDGALFMSVAPGWQSQEFKPAVLDKIKEFVNKYPDTDAAIDGGINKSNIFQASKAGAINICVGSALFASGDLAENIRALKDQLS